MPGGGADLGDSDGNRLARSSLVEVDGHAVRLGSVHGDPVVDRVDLDGTLLGPLPGLDAGMSIQALERRRDRPDARWREVADRRDGLGDR